MIGLTEEKLQSANQLLKHIPGAFPKAAANAINRSAEGSRTDAVKKVREEYFIQAGRVRETMEIRRATTSDLTASVISRGRPRALSYFKIKPGKSTKRRPNGGVFAQVKKSGGGVIAKSFVAQMASGHVGVFNRSGKDPFPIEQRHGPSVAQMLGSQSVSRYVEREATRRVDERLDHEVYRMLRGYGK